MTNLPSFTLLALFCFLHVKCFSLFSRVFLFRFQKFDYDVSWCFLGFILLEGHLVNEFPIAAVTNSYKLASLKYLNLWCYRYGGQKTHCIPSGEGRVEFVFLPFSASRDCLKSWLGSLYHIAFSPSNSVITSSPTLLSPSYKMLMIIMGPSR